MIENEGIVPFKNILNDSAFPNNTLTFAIIKQKVFNMIVKNSRASETEHMI